MADQDDDKPSGPRLAPGPGGDNTNFPDTANDGGSMTLVATPKKGGPGTTTVIPTVRINRSEF